MNNIAGLIDQTYLKKGASEEEIRKVAEEAKEYGFRGFCVFPEHTKIAKEDLKDICKILPTKVIIGSGYLTDEEIKQASEIVKKSGAICVKTATVNDPLDHTELPEKAKHVKIMKESAPGLLVKAAGSIRTAADAKMMVQAGANIIGTSSGKEIVDETKGQEIKVSEDWR